VQALVMQHTNDQFKLLKDWIVNVPPSTVSNGNGYKIKLREPQENKIPFRLEQS
jgi:hypothetical protein